MKNLQMKEKEENLSYVDRAIIDLHRAAELVFLPGWEGELFCREIIALVEVYGDSQNTAIAKEIYDLKVKPEGSQVNKDLRELEPYQMISMIKPQEDRVDYVVLDNDGFNYLRIVSASEPYKQLRDSHSTLSYKDIEAYSFMVLNKEWDEVINW